MRRSGPHPPNALPVAPAGSVRVLVDRMSACVSASLGVGDERLGVRMRVVPWPHQHQRHRRRIADGDEPHIGMRVQRRGRCRRHADTRRGGDRDQPIVERRLIGRRASGCGSSGHRSSVVVPWPNSRSASRSRGRPATPHSLREPMAGRHGGHPWLVVDDQSSGTSVRDRAADQCDVDLPVGQDLRRARRCVERNWRRGTRPSTTA